jgi:hypothetical protein
VLEITGRLKHDPQRRHEREPIPSGPLGAPPAYFTPALEEIWAELTRETPAGVLTSADRWIVEIACGLMLKFRDVGLIPQVGMTGAELTQLIGCLARMGLTPADRSRVGVPTEREQDAFAQFAAEQRERLRPN